LYIDVEYLEVLLSDIETLSNLFKEPPLLFVTGTVSYGDLCSSVLSKKSADYPVKLTSAPSTAFATPQNTVTPPSWILNTR